MSAYLNLIFYIQNFFLVNFRYVANVFFVVSCRWNQESAGRIYFNISRETPTHTPDTPYVHPLSPELEWTNQKHFNCFLLRPIRDNLVPEFARALPTATVMRRRDLGSRMSLKNDPRERFFLAASPPAADEAPCRTRKKTSGTQYTHLTISLSIWSQPRSQSPLLPVPGGCDEAGIW